MTQTPMPKVIFLDAVGTLFKVRGSVGATYGRLARQFGVNVPIEQINTAFYACFDRAPEAAFPHADPTERPQLEYAWWREVAMQTFQMIGVFEQFDRFDDFFELAFHFFATAAAWEVYPDTLPALQSWQDQGIELGMISNFDSRLYAVLDQLGLAPFFQSVTISTEVGAAKPSPLIFALALAKHDCQPQDALHIGDSRSMDFEGAIASGLQAIWLDRPDL